MKEKREVEGRLKVERTHPLIKGVTKRKRTIQQDGWHILQEGFWASLSNQG